VLESIELEMGLGLVGIGSMASETGILEDRPDVALNSTGLSSVSSAAAVNGSRTLIKEA
jgi:hypothetical protein